MDRNKPISITIIGWYIIIFGLIKACLVNSAKPADNIILGNVLSVILLVCGIGILLLKNHARLTVITYLATNGTISILFYCYGLVATIISFNKPSADPAGYTTTHAVMWIIVMLVIVSAFYFLPILFLCDPKIKEKFTQPKKGGMAVR